MDKTFRTYTKEQSDHYAKNRRDYHPSVYETVLNQHTSTGGQFDLVIDVGCGPGRATRHLAQHFNHAIGLDPSEAMISSAREAGGVTSTSNPVRYEVSEAEELGKNIDPPISDSSVDLIIAANAAHWFDMENFWISAARVLKPGGSVALWTTGDIRAHPDMPASAAVQDVINKHQEEYLKPHYEPGNFLARGRYVDLPLPWTLQSPIPAFDKETFYRREWAVGEPFVLGEAEVNMKIFEMVMGTASPVTRWRKANPERVGTEEDVIRILRRDIERVLQEAGVEKGKEFVKGTALGAVLVVKKKKNA